jgi:PAS domain S-box-containing protein
VTLAAYYAVDRIKKRRSFRHAPLHDVFQAEGSAMTDQNRMHGSPAPETGSHALPEEYCRQLFESMVHGVTFLDASGAIVAANPAAHRILGLSFDAMSRRVVNRPLWRTVREDGSEFPFDEFPSSIALRTGQPVAGVVMGIFRSRHGACSWLSVSASPIPASGAGPLQGVFVTFEDITARKFAEEQLQVSEARFRVLFEQALVGMAQTAPNGRLIAVNQRFCTILGYSAYELIGRHFTDITEDTFVALSKQAFQRCLSGEIQNAILEKQYRRKDGSTIWAQVHISLIRDANDAPHYFLAVVEDITDRKRHEAEHAQLFAQEQAARAIASAKAEELDAIFNSLSDGAVVFDHHGMISHINAVVRATWGLGEKELSERVAHHHAEYLTLNGAEMPFDQWPITRILRGEELTGQNLAEITIKTPANDTRTYSVSGTPLRNADGTLRGGIILLRDMSAQILLEHRTQQTLDRLIQLMIALIAHELPFQQSIPPNLAQHITDATCAIIGSEQCAVALRDAQTDTYTIVAATGVTEMERVRWQERINHGGLPLWFSAEEIARLERGSVLLDFANVSTIPELQGICIAPIHSENCLRGLVLVRGYDPFSLGRKNAQILLQALARLTSIVFERDHALNILHAKQELETQYHQIQEASRLKSEFLANMSHELRTPLNAIIGFTELLLRGYAGALLAPQQEFLNDVLTSAKHLLRLLDDVLDLSKVEAGKMVFYPEATFLTQIMQEVHAIVHPLAAKKRLKITIDIDPVIDAVTLDPGKFKQVLYNYLSNAIKFTPDEGQISVQASDAGNNAFRLDVRDSGIGIALQDIERLFVAFQQLDTGTRKKYQGTGLGLALSKQIVEAQGGRVGVASVVGQGSTFWALLPRHISAQNERPDSLSV